MKIYYVICLLYLVKADSEKNHIAVRDVSYGSQPLQYKVYEPNNDQQMHNQNVRTRILDHYVLPTEGSPTIQTLYTSSSGSQQPIIGNSQKYSYPNQQVVSPTITINSNQGINNFNNKNLYQNQPYSNAELRNRYISAPTHEQPTTVSPTVQIGSSTTASQSSQSSSSSSSSSSSTSSSVNSVATTVNPNHINLVPSGGSSVQIVPDQNQNNYHQVDLNNLSPNYNIYGSSTVSPVEAQSIGNSFQSSFSENSNSQSQSSNFTSVSQTNLPTIPSAYSPALIHQPGYETSNSFQNSNSNSESKSKINNGESNISIMSITPVPYNIAISRYPSVGIPSINHQIGHPLLPPSTYQSVDTSPPIYPVSTFGPPKLQPIDLSHPPLINTPKSPNPMITIASSNGIQSLVPTNNIQHIPIVTNVPVTQFQEHQGVVSKTVNVAQPGIKKQTFEIRKPAIQKQYYDIEEKVIVRPAGSVLVEIDEPLSKTSKGSAILPVGHPIITEHNDAGSFGNQNTNQQNNLISFATNQQTLTSNLQGNYPGIASICNQFNPHYAQSYLPSQYSYSSGPVQSQTYYPPLITHSADNNKFASPVMHAPFYFDYQPNSKFISHKLETENAKERHPQGAGYLNAHPQQIHQHGYSAKLQAVPFMISVGDPNFNYPPFVNKGGKSQPVTKASYVDPGAHTLYAMSNIINNDDLKQEDPGVAASEVQEVRAYSPDSNHNAPKSYIPNNTFAPSQKQYLQPLTNVPVHSSYDQKPIGGIQYYQELPAEKTNHIPSNILNQSQPVSIHVSGNAYNQIAQPEAATSQFIENPSENYMYPSENPIEGVKYYQHPQAVDSQSQILKTPNGNEYNIRPQPQNLAAGIQYYQHTPILKISDQNYSIPQQQVNIGSSDHVNISFDNNSNYPKVEIHNISLPIKNNVNSSAETNYFGNAVLTIPTPQATTPAADKFFDKNLEENSYPRYENYQDNQNLNGRGDLDIPDNNPSSSNNVNIHVPPQYNNYNNDNLEYMEHGKISPGSPPIGGMNAPMISANPVSSENQPAGERTHVRRIVVNQPIETVQIIEEEQPITNVKQVTIQQPMYYKTASVGLKKVYSSIPIFVNHQIPANPNSESCH